MEVVALPPGGSPDTHCGGGYMDPRAVVDGCEEEKMSCTHTENWSLVMAVPSTLTEEWRVTDQIRKLLFYNFYFTTLIGVSAVSIRHHQEVWPVFSNMSLLNSSLWRHVVSSEISFLLLTLIT